MKKLFSIFAIASLILVAMPSCSTSDSFEDVVMESSIEQPTVTDDEEPIKDKPGD